MWVRLGQRMHQHLTLWSMEERYDAIRSKPTVDLLQRNCQDLTEITCPSETNAVQIRDSDKGKTGSGEELEHPRWRHVRVRVLPSLDKRCHPGTRPGGGDVPKVLATVNSDDLETETLGKWSGGFVKKYDYASTTRSIVQALELGSGILISCDSAMTKVETKETTINPFHAISLS